jgi:hypothetical protein
VLQLVSIIPQRAATLSNVFALRQTATAAARCIGIRVLPGAQYILLTALTGSAPAIDPSVTSPPTRLDPPRACSACGNGCCVTESPSTNVWRLSRETTALPQSTPWATFCPAPRVRVRSSFKIRRLCRAGHRFCRLTFVFAGEESRKDPEICLSLASHVLPHRTLRPAR